MARTSKPGSDKLQAFTSPLVDLPYRALVYAHSDGNKVPLYYVAGQADGPWGAGKALMKSHEKHGGHCFYCRKPITKGHATIDHIEPVSLGGKSEIQNLALSCKPCNAAKAHKAIEAFNPDAGKEWLEALLKQVQQRLNRL